MECMTGQVRRSINNVYNVFTDEGCEYVCRIKGKKLVIPEFEYNPIAVGDYVVFEPYSESEGLVTERLERSSSFVRWNVKLEKNQTIAANMDQVAIICSSETPPFRPRFLDRAIACVRGCEVLLVMNKCDQCLTEEEYDRWCLYRDLGFRTMAVSAATGENLDKLVSLLKGKVTAFTGQSGVGKSTLVNAILHPEVEQKTGEVSEKFQRGRHTTNHSLYLEGPEFSLIDTPGVRELLVPYEEKSELCSAFPEFSSFECGYSGCLHLEEPGCAVKEAVMDGKIDVDRYQSYVGMQESLAERSPAWARNRFRKNKQ